MAGGRGASRVPERWTDYIPLGCRMPGTRFIAFKVPLKKSFDQNLLPEERFSPHDLIRKVEELKEELGLIIDLTYTTRYYGREELPPTLRYAKILTMGHEIPNRKTISRFRYLVKKFLTRNKDNDKLIGVHCTHGLNRTGYLVCRYLIDVEGMEPNAAIELFNKSRGHPIERTNYIRDLQRRALKNCEPKNSGSDVFREKGSAPGRPQKQLGKHHPSQAPLAVPRSPSSTKKEQRPEPRAQGQPQELEHGHRALGQRQLKKLEQRQQEHLEQSQLEQKKLERRQQKKLKHLEQNHLEQRQQKKVKHQEQNHLEQRQQKKLKHQEQRQEKKLKQLEQNHQEQNHLEQRQLEEQNHLEQRQQKKLKHLEQNHQEQRQQKKLKHQEQNHLEQRQQKKLKHLEQNHLEQRQQKKLYHLEQNHLEQNHQEQRQLEEQHHLEQRQPCSLAPRNCWLSPAPRKKHKELFPVHSSQPQEPSPARKRRHRKHELKEQEMS
ncbi:RNA/RNP complex-1-interacting phosphatase isoform 2-T2 [Sylvia borin]